jgi:beta-glucosidase
LLSGRPLWLNRELNAANAFVAAWLPGSEGGGIADLLLAGPDGHAAFDFTGRLPFSWPRFCDRYGLKAGDPGYDPLFPLGFGLSYRQTRRGPVLDENCAALLPAHVSLLQLIAAGRPVAPARWSMLDQDGIPAAIVGRAGKTPLGHLTTETMDRRAQEDARRFSFSGPASIAVEAAWDSSRRSAFAAGLLTIEYSVSRRPGGTARLIGRCGPNCGGEIDITQELALAEGKGWRTLTLPIDRLIRLQQAAGRATIQLQSSGTLDISVSSIALSSP